MANNCVILFDQNEYGTYFTGQLLTGKVVITLNKPKSYRGIKLQINGYAQCQWRERRGRQKPIYNKNLKRKHTFVGHEDYIASTTFLVGCEEETQNITLDSGTHTYTFSCPIPTECPSSYEGTYGHIRYIVKVTFIRKGVSNRVHTKGFTVLKLIDLNKESALLKSPASNETFENFCFFYSKMVHLRVDITQTGFVPGQIILVSCHVNNESKADVKNLLITLNLRATYTSATPHMRSATEKLCLVKKLCGPVAHQSVKSFDEMIRVPATPPTCDHLSKVVRISYEICVKAIMKHFMSDPKTIIPITIGNIPLVSLLNDDVATTSACGVQLAEPVAYNLLSEDTEMDYELLPPSYEEAMFMTTNVADDDVNTVNENAQFTPRYPVYDVDNIAMLSNMSQSPPPNPPQKRRKIKPNTLNIEEKPSMESPIET